jgi:sarcosine oxidase subunit beta
MKNEAEIIIIGAGVIGLSIASHLVQKGINNILILEEKDAAGLGATSKATGGIRHQFSSSINIQCTLKSMVEILNFKKIYGADLDFKPTGYLLLATNDEILNSLTEGYKIQKEYGLSTVLLNPDEIKKFIPALNVEDVKIGSFCPQDGVADPFSMLYGFESFLHRNSINFEMNTKVLAIEPQANKIKIKSAKGDWVAEKVIIATGPYSLNLLESFKIIFPIIPHRKQVFFVTSPDAVNTNSPLVIEFPSGWYFRYDAGLLALGMSIPEDKANGDESVDLNFAPIIIEQGLKRLPALSSSSLVRGLAGLSDATPDNHCILDKLSEIGELYAAVGFSGHGFQHAPVVGQLMTELILEGKTKTLDIAPFRWKRFQEQNVLEKESFVVT